ncbi:MAG: hypothetical protein KA275_02685 [Chitinophagaceae bacterium]|nr:hypothetical protein [Chitinophagaceae bacterium]
MVNPKHIATFLLGAAAGAAMMKYNSMTEEEKEKMMTDLKEKADAVKTEAEENFAKVKDYFEELQTKGTAAVKDQLADAEKMMQDLFHPKKNEESKA